MMENMNSEGACSEQMCSHGDQSDHSSAQPQDSAYVSLGQSQGSSTPIPSSTSQPASTVTLSSTGFNQKRLIGQNGVPASHMPTATLPPIPTMTSPDRRDKQVQITALVTNLTEVWQGSRLTSSQHHQINQLLGSVEHKERVHMSKKTFLPGVPQYEIHLCMCSRT